MTSGISFYTLLAVLFVGLKLTHYIDWSWWLVLAPIWGPGLVAIVVLIGVFAWGFVKGFREP